MKKSFFACAALLFLRVSFCFSESPEELLDEIDQAIHGEFYDRALALLEQGEESYPYDARFPQAGGELYSSRKLYNLALDALFKAEQLEPDNREIRKEIASALGFLDRNEESLVYLEGLLGDEKDSPVVDDLGWMYFKTHQPEKGIPLLKEALDQEFDRSLSLTLGTLYSEINNQELCRKYYLMAIEDALDKGDHYFASVAYYNLSLAEQSFYSYEKAIQYARLSIEQMDRAGGHLALSDLYLTKGDYASAAEEILKAEPLDETPLSTMNLATFYRSRGELNTALQLADSLQKSSDDSWMYYYGIDSMQFEADLTDLYRDIYKGLYHQEQLTSTRGWKKALEKIGRIGKYYGLYRYHDAQYRLMAFRVGRTQWERSAPLRGALTLASASEGAGQTALKYLGEARRREADLPGSSAWYDLETGRETHDAALLYQAVQTFQKDWEARLIEESYREILLLAKGGRPVPEELEAAVAIYRQNPGGLRQYGLRLPLHLSVTGTESSRFIRILKRQIHSQGFFLTSDYTGSEPVLRVHSLSGESLSYTMTWPDGTVEASERLELQGSLRFTTYLLAESLGESVFP